MRRFQRLKRIKPRGLRFNLVAGFLLAACILMVLLAADRRNILGDAQILGFAESGQISAEDTEDRSVTASPEPSPSSQKSVSPSSSLVPGSATNKNVPGESTTVEAGSQAVPMYVGSLLAEAKIKEELLNLSFDQEVNRNWTVDMNEGTAIVEGKYGKALQIISSGKYRLGGGEVFVNAGTLSFWLRIDSGNRWEESPLLAWNFDGENQHFSLFEISYVQDIMQFNLYEESGNQLDISASIKPSIWHLVETTWDLTREPFGRVIYLDGQKVAEGVMPFAPFAVSPSYFQIGGNLGNRVYAKFTIDELVLTNWAKSEQEIVGGQ